MSIEAITGAWNYAGLLANVRIGERCFIFCIPTCIGKLKMEAPCHSNQSHAGKLTGLPLFPGGTNAA